MSKTTSSVTSVPDKPARKTHVTHSDCYQASLRPQAEGVRGAQQTNNAVRGEHPSNVLIRYDRELVDTIVIHQLQGRRQFGIRPAPAL